jgi:hypothetical protein
MHASPVIQAVPHGGVASVVLAALAGAAVGIYVGPIGVAIGAVLGAFVGLFAAYGLDRLAHETAARDSKLDQELGITGGTLGAPGLSHPPPVYGAYSAASAGAGGSSFDREPAEGPFGEGDA